MIPTLPSWSLYLVGAIASAAVGAMGMAKIKNGEIAGIHLAHERAINEAIVRAQADQRDADQVVIDLTAAEAKGQDRIVEVFRTIEKEVSIYVQDTSACITYGLIRVLDAAALGADPESLLLAPGQYNDTCAPVKASDLARNVAGNYEASHRNAQQLGTLQTWAAEVARLSQ